MEPKYLESARQEVQQWENAGPGWLSHISDFVLWPATKMAEGLIPHGVMESVSKGIEKILGGASWVAGKTVAANSIEKAVEARLAEAGSHELSDGLAAADAEAKSRWNWHLGYAATEGGATGVAGFLGLAADLPALFTLVLRMIQEIGACYGFDMKKKEEHDYVLHVLRTGSAGDLPAKMEALLMLKELEGVLISVAWRKVSANLAAKQAAKFSLMGGVRELAKSLGITITRRKALQLVPIVGGIVGASFNATFANEIGRAAYMSYRRRWIAARSQADWNSAAGHASHEKEKHPEHFTGKPPRNLTPRASKKPPRDAVPRRVQMGRHR